jgi:hypothetical protein
LDLGLSPPELITLSSPPAPLHGQAAHGSISTAAAAVAAGREELTSYVRTEEEMVGQAAGRVGSAGEQGRGAARPYTPAVDVYGFGMLMYQVASGWLPISHQQQILKQAQQQQHYQQALTPAGSHRTGSSSSTAATLCRYGRKYDQGVHTADSTERRTPRVQAGKPQRLPEDVALRHEARRMDVLLHTQGTTFTAAGIEVIAVAPAIADWLPVGYEELMVSCCGSAPSGRPEMGLVRAKLEEFKKLLMENRIESAS